MSENTPTPIDSVQRLVDDVKAGSCKGHDEIRRRLGVINNEVRSGIIDINSIRRNVKYSNESLVEVKESMEYLFDEADAILEKIGAPMPSI